MPDFNIIANISATLVDVVTKAIEVVDPTAGQNEIPIAVLHDLRNEPTNQGNRPGLVAVTLVEVREDASSRNRPDRLSQHVGVSASLTRQKPPMALRLRYLVTPWSNRSDEEGRAFEHRMLGRVLQAFYENAIISGATLKGRGDSPLAVDSGLEGSDEVLKITLSQLSFEEQTRFWHAVQLKYRPSLTYEVRVVNLDATTKSSESIVVNRTLQFGGIERT